MATSRRYSIGTLGLIVSGIACQALAEPPAAPSNDNGLMTFKHARVVNAPPAAEQQPADEARAVRAFVDPVTGELTSTPTLEQARQLTNSATARSRAGVATSNVAAEEQLTYWPNGAVSLMLTDDDMVSQTVQIDADGNLIQQCVTGETEAAHAQHSQPAKEQTQQESNNDR
jgi:hypothetical protein